MILDLTPLLRGGDYYRWFSLVYKVYLIVYLRFWISRRLCFILLFFRRISGGWFLCARCQSFLFSKFISIRTRFFIRARILIVLWLIFYLLICFILSIIIPVGFWFSVIWVACTSTTRAACCIFCWFILFRRISFVFSFYIAIWLFVVSIRILLSISVCVVSTWTVLIATPVIVISISSVSWVSGVVWFFFWWFVFCRARFFVWIGWTLAFWSTC